MPKWPEVVAIPDQQAGTIARCLVEQVFTRHGLPEQLLSDKGANFLSDVLQVCKLLGIEKVNNYRTTIPRWMGWWKN